MQTSDIAGNVGWDKSEKSTKLNLCRYNLLEHLNSIRNVVRMTRKSGVK